MHSRIAGALTFLPGIAVRLAFLNLSKLLPVKEPHDKRLQDFQRWDVYNEFS